MHINLKIKSNRKSIIAAALIAALALTTAPAFAGGTAPQTTGTGGYSSVCTDFTGAGCAPLAQFDAAQATGFSSAALGWYSTASGTGALALGDFSIASGGGSSTAVGTSASATGVASTALGASANASGDQATALGTAAQATNYESTAVGLGASATSDATTAIGDSAAASGAGSTAIGTLAQATGFGGTAIGQDAAAVGYSSVALGSGSVANRPDSVSVGDAATGLDRQVTNVAPGIGNTDAVNVSQLDAGGQATAAWLGGGAAFEAAGAGTYVAPVYVLTSPGAAGSYNNVGSALLALDNGINAANARISSISLTPGPAGPQGPAGATGATGPQGAGVQPGPGTDTSAVHYDTTSAGAINYSSVTLQGKAGTQIHNLAAGAAATDAANVSQVQQALQTSESFTTATNAQTLTQAMNYTDQQIAGVNNEIGQLGQEIGSLSQRIDGLGAASQAQAEMAMACGSDRNCISAGWGEQGGQGAVAVGFRHRVYGGKAAWTAGVASSNAGTSVGVGFAINLN